MPRRVLSPRAWQGVFAFAFLVVTAFLLMPATAVPGAGSAALVPYADKLVHALMFATLAALARRAFPAAPVGAAFLVLVAYGALTEAVQGLVPGRTPSLGDLAANAAGSALALLPLKGFSRRPESGGR